MILPVAHASVLLLLIVSLLCLGVWPNTFKASGSKWRFELYSLDFGIGFLLLVAITAFTLGTLGSDLAFSDRILVAGRTKQALAVVAGGVFCLGNMLMLAGVSVLGLATAVPLSVGLALIVGSCFHFGSGNVVYLIAGMVLLAVAAVFESRAAAAREAATVKRPAATAAGVGQTARTAAPPTGTSLRAPSSGVRTQTRPSTNAPLKRKHKLARRGLIVSIIGGIILGLFQPMLGNCMPGDFGLGAYAAMLLCGIGVLLSTIVYNFYFLNIAIAGPSLTFGAYLEGTAKQHCLGFVGGALCAGGLLAASLAATAPAASNIPIAAVIALPLCSVFLVFLFGLVVWKELAGGFAVARTPLTVSVALFACGLALVAYAMSRAS